MELENQQFAIDNNISRMTWEDAEHDIKIDMAIRDGAIILNKDEIIGGTIFMDISQIEGDNHDPQREQSQLERHLKSDSAIDAQHTSEGKLTLLSVHKFEQNLKTLYSDDKEGLVENPTHNFEADLEFNGNIHEVSFPASIKKGGNALSIETKFKINKDRWDLSSKEEKPTDSKKTNAKHELVTVGFYIEAGESGRP